MDETNSDNSVNSVHASHHKLSMRALLEALAKVLSLLPERWAFERARWALQQLHETRDLIYVLTDELEDLRASGTEPDAQRADLLRSRLKDECAHLERVSALADRFATGNGSDDGGGTLHGADP